jgi:hypothetical protein
MDEQRFAELERKRDTEGLSNDEANELGRMMAERAGQPYSNASQLRQQEEQEIEGIDETAKESVEAGSEEVNRPTTDKAGPADADRPPAGTAGSGYLPPAEPRPGLEGDAQSDEGAVGTPGAAG